MGPMGLNLDFVSAGSDDQDPIQTQVSPKANLYLQLSSLQDQ